LFKEEHKSRSFGEDMTDFEKPEWIFGNEKRFYDFMKNLGDEKVLLISHTDMDGIGSAKIINEVVQANDLLFLNYTDMNDSLVSKISAFEPKKIIISDLFFKKDQAIIQEIEKFADILIIDHHSAEKDLNSEKTTHMLSQGFCATYLAFYLLSRIRDLSNIDWIVAAASLADIVYKNNPKFMKATYANYGDSFEISSDGQIKKCGTFWDVQWAISLALIAKEPDYKIIFDNLGNDINKLNEIRAFAAPVWDDYNESIKTVEKYKKPISDGYFVEVYPKYKITSLLTTDSSFKEQNKTWIFLSKSGGLCKFSARRQDGKVDLNILCQELIKGFENSNAGGHVRASAGYFPEKYLADFKKRLGIN
jgi:single-stranded DNA-specific DHH superfamily exonuclease